VALTVAERPADANHHYGHGKAEYFSAGAEGLMIFIAAAVILVTAVQRFLHPVALDSVGVGLAVSTLASAVNGAVAVVLLRAGRTYRSATLVADGRHLLTDVWTSAGVLVGVLLVGITGWQRLDAIVAAAVGLNILVTGGRLVWGSMTSLLDAALPVDDLARLDAVLGRCCEGEVGFSDVRTRESGRHRFVSVTITVPGEWSVDRAHALSHEVADAVTAELPGTEVHTHLAPR
jgi:cation diffusion facilitator family transporter